MLFRSEPRSPARLGGTPLRLEPLVVGHPMKGWIERSLLDPQGLIRSLVNALRDGIAMQRSRAVEDFENQQIQRPLQTVILVFRHTKLAIYSWLIMALTTWRVKEESPAPAAVIFVSRKYAANPGLT